MSFTGDIGVVPEDAQKFKAPSTSGEKEKGEAGWTKEAARERAKARTEALAQEVRTEAERLGLGGVTDSGTKELQAFLDQAEEAQREGVNFTHSFEFSDVPGSERKGLPTVGCHISISDDRHFGQKESVDYGLFPNRDDNESLKTNGLEAAIELYNEKYG